MAVNVLLSYAFHEKTDLAAARGNLACGRVLVDSGAFTAHTTGKTIRLDDYASFLERWRGYWDHAITLDVIGDAVATARNTRTLHERGLPVMPVFTRGQALSDFDAMVRDHGYVCAGGLVGLPRAVQVRRVGYLQQRAQELGGGIHALGIGSMGVLRAARPYSADASTATQVSRFGNLLYFDGLNLRQVHIADREKLARALPHLTAQGVPVGSVVRTGRMPVGEERTRMLRGFVVAFGCADEALRRRPVPAPPSANAPGTHLYSVIGWGQLDLTYDADRWLHCSEAPPLAWRRYGTAHTCAAAAKAG